MRATRSTAWMSLEADASIGRRTGGRRGWSGMA
jgi:hypothetical protein